MANVVMFWHGGLSYAAPDTSDKRDAEQFDSLASAKRAFAARTNDSYYPCVDGDTPDDGGPTAWVFIGRVKDVLGADYPDYVLSFGPRGGVICERA